MPIRVFVMDGFPTGITVTDARVTKPIMDRIVVARVTPATMVRIVVARATRVTMDQIVAVRDTRAITDRIATVRIVMDPTDPIMEEATAATALMEPMAIPGPSAVATMAPVDVMEVFAWEVTGPPVDTMAATADRFFGARCWFFPSPKR